MKILTISPNNKKNNINNILSSNTDSLIYNSINYNNFIESFNDEFDDIFDDKNTFIKYIEMNDPNNEINEKMKNEIYQINNQISKLIKCNINIISLFYFRKKFKISKRILY